MHWWKVNGIARDLKNWSHGIIAWTLQQGIKITKWKVQKIWNDNYNAFFDDIKHFETWHNLHMYKYINCKTKHTKIEPNYQYKKMMWLVLKM